MISNVATREQTDRLRSGLSEESDRAKTAESNLRTGLSGESDRAKEAERSLDEALSEESDRAKSAEKALDEALSKEAQAGSLADDALSTEIAAVSGALADETDRAKTAEKALDEAIGGVQTDVDGLAEKTYTKIESDDTFLAKADYDAVSVTDVLPDGNPICTITVGKTRTTVNAPVAATWTLNASVSGGALDLSVGTRT